MFQRSIVAKFLLCFACITPAYSQATKGTNKSPAKSTLTWDKAPNRWRLTPIDSGTQTDTVLPEERARRNAYWKQPAQSRILHSFETGQRPLHGDIDLRIPEVSEPSGITFVWVVAKFESYHVYSVDQDDQRLYTEVNLRLLDVIKDSSNAGVKRGTLIDVEYPGGAVRTREGRTISSAGLKPEHYSLELGHTYILQLVHRTTYGVFTPYKQWEVSSGTVKPASEDEAVRAAEGESAMDGMPLETAIAYLQSALATDAKGGKQ